MSFRIVLWLAMGVFLIKCLPQKNGASVERGSQKPEFTPVFSTQPGVMVYKTRGDYGNLVPVLLSEDKSRILSYPHPDDLRVDGRWLTPKLLSEGYYLDNKGIQLNTAFLKFTYMEYSELDSVPSLELLYKNIKDKDPFLELCDCGNKSQYEDITKQLNQWILEKKLRQICRTIL